MINHELIPRIVTFTFTFSHFQKRTVAVDPFRNPMMVDPLLPQEAIRNLSPKPLAWTSVLGSGIAGPPRSPLKRGDSEIAQQKSKNFTSEKSKDFSKDVGISGANMEICKFNEQREMTPQKKVR